MEIQLSDVIAICDDAIGSPLSATDDFFEMGGDSMAFIEVIQRLESEAGGALDLMAIVENPTPLVMFTVLRRGSGIQR